MKIQTLIGLLVLLAVVTVVTHATALSLGSRPLLYVILTAFFVTMANMTVSLWQKKTEAGEPLTMAGLVVALSTLVVAQAEISGSFITDWGLRFLALLVVIVFVGGGVTYSEHGVRLRFGVLAFTIYASAIGGGLYLTASYGPVAYLLPLAGALGAAWLISTGNHTSYASA